MPRVALTQAVVEQLPPPGKRYIIYWDRGLPNFGLLVTTKGSRSWVAHYVVRDGRQVNVTIGTMALIPDINRARLLQKLP